MSRYHHWLALGLILLIAGFLGACLDEPTSPQPERASLDEPSLAFMLVGGGAAKNWIEGSSINVEVTGNPSGAVLTAIGAAAQEWNEYVFELEGYSHVLPHVSEYPATTTQDEPKIKIEYEELGDWGWCGSAPGFNGDSTFVLEISKRDSTAQCYGRIVQDLEGVVAHEMSHAFGFQHLTSEETYWCVANVPDTGNLNHHPCTLEQQWVYQAYSLRDSIVDKNALIVQTLVISPAVDTVQVADTIQYTLLGIAGPEPSDPTGSTDTVSTNVHWTAVNTSIIAKAGETEAWVKIRGVAEGTSDLVVTGDNTTAMVWPFPTDTASVVVTSDACFTAENTTTWRYSDQFLSAACSPTGSNWRYKWKFTDAGSWTAYSADTLYEFPGHTAQDTETVSLRVMNTSTNDSTTTTTQFIVQSGLVTVSGPTYVTDKSLKTYTSNTEGDWYERQNPDTYLSWGNAIVENDDTYTRIWPAGWYDMALRNDSSTNALRRRRHNIEVCYQCSPEFNIASANFSASVQAASLADNWGLFGAGPWLSGGVEDMARYYDLAGRHEPRSPFASIAWLSDDGGAVADKAGTWSTTWSVDDTAGDGIKIVTFRVDPIDKVAGYRFGFAVDPDVGDPTDDRSGYDSTRGLVYVTGGSDETAVGLLLWEKNSNAIETVRQFGVLNMAPGTDEDARQIQESPGVQLTSDAEDVQLVLSTAEVAGTHTWQVVILKAASVSELQALADKVEESK